MKLLVASLLLIAATTADAAYYFGKCDMYPNDPTCVKHQDPMMGGDPKSVPELDSLGAPLAGAIAITVLALGFEVRRRRKNNSEK